MRIEIRERIKEPGAFYQAEFNGKQTTRFHPDRGMEAPFADTPTAPRSAPLSAAGRAALAPILACPIRLDRLPGRLRRVQHTRRGPCFATPGTSPPAIGWKEAARPAPACPREWHRAVRCGSAETRESAIARPRRRAQQQVSAFASNWYLDRAHNGSFNPTTCGRYWTGKENCNAIGRTTTDLRFRHGP